ncbi:MAG: hypothetical protein IJZ22_08105 [Bacteroidaceae bacterium]|nr:hypothetical protein [Bacteroidaceae bacterium]
MHEPTELLALITGKWNREFGFEFIKAFNAYFKQDCNNDRVTATGIGCSLFLSSITQGFPTDKLNTFVRNVREDCPFLAFNCNNYEQLYNTMEKGPLLLIDGNLNYHKCKVKKEDIFEAFDFVTNI